jgi:succinoglycan biosynthesis transport protein ExoP
MNPLTAPSAPHRAADSTEPPFSTPATLTAGDIYYTLFRHKVKILLCALAGAVAAGAVRFLGDPPYESEAKLLVRYVLSESRALGGEAGAKSPDPRGDTIMKSEAEILGSLDLVRQVVDATGPERILGPMGAAGGPAGAVAAVRSNLSIRVAPATSVIHIAFRHPDPELVQPILRDLISRYLRLHLETHTANGLVGDVLSQETDRLRARLARTEEELRKATAAAGVISPEDARREQAERISGLRRELLLAQAGLAERSALLERLRRREPAVSLAGPTPPPEIATAYEGLVQQALQLRQVERELLAQFTPESGRVREVRERLDLLLARRDALMVEHPALAEHSGAPGRLADPGRTEEAAAHVAALEARVAVLSRGLEEARAEHTRAEESEGRIQELRRQRDLEDTNLRRYAASLEQERIGQTLGGGRVANISQIQTPSPPFADSGGTRRTAGMLLAGGLLVGLAWAFLTEWYLDRSLKRSVDVERELRTPLLIDIPLQPRRNLEGVAALLAPGKPEPEGAPPPRPHPLRPFHETLRDRLIADFEARGLTHKPKLVAVTGLGRGAGVSTTAAGLARSFSETGDGSVLLVSFAGSSGSAHHFLHGRAAGGLEEMLSNGPAGVAGANLFIAAEDTAQGGASSNLPRRFRGLVPRLKSSSFDYVIFDMPPVSQISVTPRLASFMDLVLVVVEAERTDRDVARRALGLLEASGARAGVVLNRSRRYIPALLHEDHLATP